MNTQRTNAREDHCNECGGIVPAGEGSLWWEPGPDDGGDVVRRTPAGWRVTHLRTEHCGAERDRRVQEKTEKIAAGKAKYAAERAVFEAELDAIKAVIDAAITEHGLVPVPHTHCTIPHGTEEVLYKNSAYPAQGGASHERYGRVVRQPEGVIATFGHVDQPSRWASPALVEQGISHWRTHQYWIPVFYGPDTYPGPGVPEVELTEAELAIVALRTAEKKAAIEARLERLLRISIENETRVKRLVALPGATYSVEKDSESWDRYVKSQSFDYRSPEYGKENLLAVVKIALPSEHFTKGRLRKATAKWIFDQEFPLNNFTRCQIVVTEAGAAR